MSKQTNTQLLLIFGALAMGSVALAAEPGDKPGVVVKPVDWSEFKERCANPQKFPDIQIAPQHIQFQCVDTQRDWVSEQPGVIPLKSWRHVSGAVISDKFAVAGAAEESMLPGKGGSCLRYKEVERTLKLEVPMSCNDIQKWGSPVEYCKLAADSAKGANPKLVSSKDTGQVIDTCGGNPKPLAMD